MHRHSAVLVLCAILGAGLGCDSGRRSSSGFRLADDADIERGKAAFVALGCHSCHRVSGVDAPAPTVQPPVPVVLGGEVHRVVTDGFLVASIINPSYNLGRYPKELVAVSGKSRMPLYADKMTVRQLTDLVAFLQSRYAVRMTSPKYAY